MKPDTYIESLAAKNQSAWFHKEDVKKIVEELTRDRKPAASVKPRRKRMKEIRFFVE